MIEAIATAALILAMISERRKEGRPVYSRRRLTDRLEPIIRSIEAGGHPFEIEALYVFGSYSRGALISGDLDLVVIIPWHSVDPRFKTWDGRKTFYSAVRKALSIYRKRDYDLMVARNIKEYADKDPVLVWSKEKPDWRMNLEKIVPDLAAGRFDRRHLFDLKRGDTSLDTMEAVVEMIDNEVLLFEKEPVDLESTGEIVVVEGGHNPFRYMSKEVRLQFPYMEDWIFERARTPDIAFSDDGKRLHTTDEEIWGFLGRPDLRDVLFKLTEGADAVAVMLPIRKRSPNYIFVFSHGPAWDSKSVHDKAMSLW
jgi:predicted nucleotidyltransferase